MFAHTKMNSPVQSGSLDEVVIHPIDLFFPTTHGGAIQHNKWILPLQRTIQPDASVKIPMVSISQYHAKTTILIITQGKNKQTTTHVREPPSVRASRPRLSNIKAVLFHA